MKHWLSNSLFIGLIVFIYCFGSIQWDSFNPKDPLQSGRIAFEWHLPKEKGLLSKGQQNLGEVWQWILRSTQPLQHQVKQMPWLFPAWFSMESPDKRAQR